MGHRSPIILAEITLTQGKDDIHTFPSQESVAYEHTKCRHMPTSQYAANALRFVCTFIDARTNPCTIELHASRKTILRIVLNGQIVQERLRLAVQHIRSPACTVLRANFSVIPMIDIC